jgi:predicted TIM-barrel fold metal-dependent hydrolase
MRIERVKAELLRSLLDIEVIDAHEHLLPEERRTGIPVDAFTLFSGYTPADLRLAGMTDEQYRRMRDAALPLGERWEILAPFWKRMQFGSYARAILIGVRALYGIEDIDARTIEPLSRAMAAGNTPGIYDRVLRQACGIRRVLTHLDVRQHPSPDLGTSLILPVPLFVYEIHSWESIERPVFAPDARVRTLDDYIEAGRAFIVRMQAGGAPGLKMGSAPYGPPSREAAETAFEGVRKGTLAIHPLFNPIHDYVIDELIGFAASRGMVIAVHTGYWGDFRERGPLNMIPLIQRHPDARFDIFHLGYPWVRESLMLGKGFPNVWLNLCWDHVISQRMATDALRESLDLLPTNRIIAFGGDYGPESLEKIYGHLQMAKEDAAEALAERVAARRMSERQAREVAQAWFYDNPRELYRIEPQG